MIKSASSQSTSDNYELDTSLNYSVPVITAKNKFTSSSTAIKAATEILKHSQQTDGYCLVYGLKNATLAFEIARQSKLRVIAYDNDIKRVNALRMKAYKAGIHGQRLTIIYKKDMLTEIDITDNIFNLIISERYSLQSLPKPAVAEL